MYTKTCAPVTILILIAQYSEGGAEGRGWYFLCQVKGTSFTGHTHSIVHTSLCRFAPDQASTGPHEGSQGLAMASNPAPTDLSTSQLVIDATSGALRRRADEERTAAGAGIEHNKFIYCPALGVSALPSQRDSTMHTPPRHVPRDVS